MWRYLWCNGYCRRKWTLQPKFKSWMRLFAFYHSANTLGKGMNPTILFPDLSEIAEQTRFFSFGMATNLRERRLWIQIC